MRTIRLSVCLAAICALSSVLSSSAMAQIGPWGAWGTWYSYPYAASAFNSDWRSMPNPPYFAVHPPVYYGPRIRMAYGHSPFARPPLTVVDSRGREDTVEAPLQTGLMISNPYVVVALSDSGKEATVAKRQIVDNPYYLPKDADGTSEPVTATRPGGLALGR